MILEQEQILFWRRRAGEDKPTYLHYAQYLEKEDADEWEGPMQAMIKKMQG
jgi:hypothetical protein